MATIRWSSSRRPIIRWPAARDISKERIAEEHFLIREPGSGTRISLEIFLADVPGRIDDLGIEMGSNETIKQAVMAGLGIAFISAHTIASEVEAGRLVILDVVGMPIRRQWFAVMRIDHAISPAMATFHDFLMRKGAVYLPLVGRLYPDPVAVGRSELFDCPTAMPLLPRPPYRLGQRVEPLLDQRRNLADIGQRLHALLEDAGFPGQPVGARRDLVGVRVRLGAQRVDLRGFLAQPRGEFELLAGIAAMPEMTCERSAFMWSNRPCTSIAMRSFA